MTRLLFISLLCIIGLISAVYGDLSSSGSSEISVSDQNLEGVNAVQHPQSNSLLPATNKHDKALVVAPDGTVSLMEISSKKVIWSFTSGTPIYSSYQTIPNREADKRGASSLSGRFFIDLGQDDWELYMHVNDSTIVKLGFSAEELIRRAPYVSPDAILLGMKNTTVFLVDAKSGSVIRTFESAGSPNIGDLVAAEKPVVARKYEERQEPTAVDVDAVEQLLYITRTDYTLKYSSQKTGQVLWHLTFTDIEASFQCQRIEKLFGGGFSEGDDFCQTRPGVYRIHDPSSLESILVSTKLVKFPSRDRPLSLPVPDIKRQKFEGETVPALLHSQTEDPPIFSLLEPMRLPGAHQNVEGNSACFAPF